MLYTLIYGVRQKSQRPLKKLYAINSFNGFAKIFAFKDKALCTLILY